MNDDRNDELVREGATTADVPPPAVGSGATWFGHPRALSTLFFTEMWERFSYYGMRALLILFMTAPVAQKNPGLGFGVEKSSAIYGLYTAMVYLLALPGGWVADKLWGQRRAVFVGGCIIASGHFAMAAPIIGLPELPFFFGGLILIVIGTGLLKPNVSSIVGDLYPRPDDDDEAAARPAENDAAHWGARRDAGFSVFYMGINLGAILGPFFCGLAGENVSFHLGFSLAGFGMVLGLIQYKLGDHHFGSAGLLKGSDSPAILSRRARTFYLAAAAIALIVVIFGFLATSGVIATTLTQVATWIGFGILTLVLAYFAYLILDIKWAVGVVALWAIAIWFFLSTQTSEVAARNATLVTLGAFIVICLAMLAIRGAGVSMQQRRLMVIVWLFLLAALFWSGFEQAGSSMNLFAEELTDRVVFGWEMPTSWLQMVNPWMIVIFAPIFGWLWTALARRNANPSIPVKFALGLLGLSAGFFVLAWGAANASADAKVGMSWLVVTYFLHTVGELCLSPVGLSSMTKLAPRDRVGQMMGIWFVAASLGNLIAGLVAGQLESLAPSALFQSVAMIIGGGGLVALLLSPLVRRLMGHVD